MLEQLKSKNGNLDVNISSNNLPVDFEYDKLYEEIHLKGYGYPITKETGKDKYGQGIEKEIGQVFFFEENYPHIKNGEKFAKIFPADAIVLDDKSTLLISYQIEK